MRPGSVDRWGSFIGAALGVALTGLVAAGCGGAKGSAAKTTTVPCQTAQSCRQAISKLAGQIALVPTTPELEFVSGQSAAPGATGDGLYGSLQYHDTSSGWTVNYLVWSVAQEAASTGDLAPTNCYTLQSFTSPGGRSGCYQDQAMRWNQLYTKYPHDGLVYVMNARDPRSPSPTVSAEDQRWAIRLVDSYQ